MMRGVNERSDLSTRLRARRVELGLTQAQLAGESGVSEPTIRGIETGRVASPRRSTLKALSIALWGDTDGFDDEDHGPSERVDQLEAKVRRLGDELSETRVKLDQALGQLGELKLAKVS